MNSRLESQSAGLVCVCLLVVLSGRAADEVDLADFLPLYEGARFSYDGVFADNGKVRPSTMTVVVAKMEKSENGITFQTETKTSYMGKNLKEIATMRLDSEGFRLLAFDTRHGSDGETQKHFGWLNVLPKTVEIGGSYPIDDQAKGKYSRFKRHGYVEVTRESVKTAIGTFECICLTQKIDFVSRGLIVLTRNTRKWYARDFGLVQFHARTTSVDMPAGIERAVTVVSSSRPVVFKPVLGPSILLE